MVKVILAKKLLQANNNMALLNRQMLQQKGVVMVNLIGSPGAGKTTLLEKTLPFLTDKMTVAVIEGDIFTTSDAERIQKCGVEVVQINTEGACHLDANMMAEAMKQLPLDELDLIIVENVGNLVCPAEFDLGEDIKVAVTSVTEGMDKPVKYPIIFNEALATVITKADLLPHTDFVLGEYINQLIMANNDMRIFITSAFKDEGIEEWSQFLGRLVWRKRRAMNII